MSSFVGYQSWMAFVRCAFLSTSRSGSPNETDTAAISIQPPSLTSKMQFEHKLKYARVKGRGDGPESGGPETSVRRS